MMFRDRKDAGERLGDALGRYRGGDALVLAVPNGGVAVGRAVAAQLRAPLTVLVTRKLPLPDNPEAGFGAVAEDGSLYLTEEAVPVLGQEVVDRVIAAQRTEVKRRIDVLRDGAPLPALAGRTVILVDDGIAMGSTMRASVACCRNRDAGRVVVAAPVASPRARTVFAGLADEVEVLRAPAGFRAVAEAYENWYDVSDAEAKAILESANSERG